MRVGIDVDILGLSNTYTGIPNYIRYLVDGLTKLEPSAHRIFLVSRRPVFANESLPGHFSQAVARWPFKRGWNSLALPCSAWRLKLDLLHLPAFSTPIFAPCPLVVTVHDLAYLVYPDCCQQEIREYLTRRVPFALKKASAVITPTASVKREIVKYFGLPEEKIFPVWHGVSPKCKVLARDVVAKIRSELALPEPFVLFVGTVEPRKNLRRLIEAYGRAVAQGLEHSLVIAGMRGWLCEEIYELPRRLGLEKKVIFLGYVPDDLLHALYNAADLFIYPSLYEGFGLPVLEAMACGTPVIASRIPSLSEVVGEAAMLVEPLDADAIASAMLFLAGNHEARRSLAQKGLERAREFSWEKTAQETIRVYEAALEFARRSALT
ncbi:glycosyltransferase family 4 protein [Desulfovirgula thermocuniculi]|uniref:glycosyltransferase family 4 protein n=1 Tax=Desulfovirgula thermocuniculi TaxID=348842 RepID=UPI0003FAAE8C|nr:glycosyltransferase family 1 protein [Desulfovirgula thermocuniculi]